MTQPTAAGCKSILLTVLDLGIPLNFPLHCPLNPPSSGGSSTVQSQKMAALNDYLLVLQDRFFSNGEDFHIEKQATIISKINLFLNDTLDESAMDSVTAILEDNPGFMSDTDIQVIFAKMLQGKLYDGQ